MMRVLRSKRVWLSGGAVLLSAALIAAARLPALSQPGSPSPEEALREKADKTEADWEAQAAAHADEQGEVDPNESPSPDEPLAAWETAIQSDVVPAPPGGGMFVTNAYTSSTDELDVQVVAGAMRSVQDADDVEQAGLDFKTGQGVLWLEVIDRATRDDVPPSGLYYSPEATGALAIKSFDGSVLTVVSEEGVSYAFDWRTGEFKRSG